MSLPFAISFAVTMDLALNAAAAVFGPEHLTLVSSPMGQFGVLVASGIVFHQSGLHLREFSDWFAPRLHRFWRRLRRK
jgi:hypothetical protein